LVRFSTGVKRSLHAIKDNGNLFSFELINETLNTIQQDPKKVQMQLVAHFLFLHPNYKRLIDFLSDFAVTKFLKTFRHYDLKYELNFMALKYFNEYETQLNESSWHTSLPDELLTKISSSSCIECCEKCLTHAKSYFRQKLSGFIESYFDDLDSIQVKKTATEITIYKAIEKIKQWIASNIKEEFFFEELKSKIGKFIKLEASQQQWNNNNSSINKQSAHPSAAAFDEIKQNLQKLLSKFSTESKLTDKFNSEDMIRLISMNLKPSIIFNEIKVSYHK
jgi:hypothetical protein